MYGSWVRIPAGSQKAKAAQLSGFFYADAVNCLLFFHILSEKPDTIGGPIRSSPISSITIFKGFTRYNFNPKGWIGQPGDRGRQKQVSQPARLPEKDKKTRVVQGYKVPHSRRLTAKLPGKLRKR
jgi:hypothetical protein